MTNEELRLYELARIAQQEAIRKRSRRLASPARPAAPPRAIKRSPSQRRGDEAENRARCFLEAAGLTVLGHNLRSKTGEIDLVCLDGGVLAFVEVRQRRSNHYGGAAASVDLRKQRRLILTARYFLPSLTKRYFNGITPACRFDVVAVEPQELSWLKHAFTAL